MLQYFGLIMNRLPTETIGEYDDSPNHTLIFLHIPKTGGKTIQHLLASRYNKHSWAELHNDLAEPDLNNVLLRDLTAMPAAYRNRYKYLCGHLKFGVHRLLSNHFDYIALFRNPVDREISWFYFLLANPNDVNYHRAASCKDFSEFVFKQIGVQNGMLKQLLTAEQFNCTQDWRERLEIAKENLRNRFLVIGDIKKFDECLILLKKALGWKIQPVYLKKNVTQKRPKVDEIDPSVRDKIGDNNRWDMELFGYVKSVSLAELSRQHPDFFREVEAFKNLTSLYQKAVQDFDAADYASARLKFESALEIEPNSPDINNCLALVYEKLKEPISALQCYKQALSVNPSGENIIRNCANLLTSMKMGKEAEYFRIFINK